MKIKRLIAAIALASTSGCATLGPDIVDADATCASRGYVHGTPEYWQCIDTNLELMAAANAQSQDRVEDALRAFATAFLISSMDDTAVPAPASRTPLTGLTCTPWLNGVRCVPSI